MSRPQQLMQFVQLYEKFVPLKFNRETSSRDKKSRVDHVNNMFAMVLANPVNALSKRTQP